MSNKSRKVCSNLMQNEVDPGDVKGDKCSLCRSLREERLKLDFMNEEYENIVERWNIVACRCDCELSPKELLGDKIIDSIINNEIVSKEFLGVSADKLAVFSEVDSSNWSL